MRATAKIAAPATRLDAGLHCGIPRRYSAGRYGVEQICGIFAAGQSEARGRQKFQRYGRIAGNFVYRLSSADVVSFPVRNAVGFDFLFVEAAFGDSDNAIFA